MVLSLRKADQTPLLDKLLKDSDLQAALKTKLDDTRLYQLAEWVGEKYGASIEESHQAIQHFLRPRLSQRNIFIPPTSDNPKGKVMPNRIEDDEPVGQDQEAKIDAVPPVTEQDKKEVVSDAVEEDPLKNRQQKLIDATAGLKVTINQIAQGMFQLDLTQDALGDISKKVIESIGVECGKQTANVVKTLVSPVTP